MLFQTYPYFLASVIILLIFLWRLRFDTITILLFIIAALFYYFHLSQTPYFSISNDASRHLDYVEYIAMNWSLPPPKDNPAFRHPPLYYFFSAIMYKLGIGEGEAQAIANVRQFSMALFLAHQLVVVFILRRLLSGVPFYMALAVVLFWPVSLTMGARITCNLTLYLFSALCFYFLLRWQERFSHKFLSLSLVMVALGLLAKNAMQVWLPVVTLVFLYHLLRKRFVIASLKRIDLGLSLFLIVIVIIATRYRSLIFQYMQTPFTRVRVLLPGEVRAWESVLSFDPVFFMTSTIYEILPPTAENFSFAGMFLRSMTLGQFVWFSDTMTLLISILLLAFLLMQLMSAALHWRKLIKEYELFLFLGVSAGSLIGSMLLMYLTIANPYYANLRYVFFLVVIMAIFIGKLLEWSKESECKLLYRANIALISLFLTVSIATVLTQNLWQGGYLEQWEMLRIWLRGV